MKVNELYDLMAHLSPDDEIRIHTDPESHVTAIVLWQPETDDEDANLRPTEPIYIEMFPEVHGIDVGFNEPGEGNSIVKSDETKIIIPKKPLLKVIK